MKSAEERGAFFVSDLPFSQVRGEPMVQREAFYVGRGVLVSRNYGQVSADRFLTSLAVALAL
jgi:hypothetical protein